MTVTPLNLVPDHDVIDASPSAAAVLDVLANALRDRAVPPCPTLARGATASSDEGLALVQSFLAITDPKVRQAILHAAAALAGIGRP